MNSAAKKTNGFDQSDCSLEPGSSVPESGLYEICHADEPRAKVILTRESTFPFCRKCEERVRYKLLQAVPHISEDPDFTEFSNDPYNPPEHSAAPKRELPLQLGRAHGFRFWQNDLQAWGESEEPGNLQSDSRTAPIAP
jgi:hypothetical protein